MEGNAEVRRRGDAEGRGERWGRRRGEGEKVGRMTRAGGTEGHMWVASRDLKCLVYGGRGCLSVRVFEGFEVANGVFGLEGWIL